MSDPNMTAAEHAYCEGAQSRQDEIDELKKQRDSFIKAHHISMNDVCEHKAKIDELQARIDEALTQVNNHKHSCEARKRLKHMSASVSEIAEIEAHESNMYVLENILKGNKDEK